MSLVIFTAQFAYNGDNTYVNPIIQATTNNSSYATSVTGAGHITRNSSSTTYSTVYTDQLFDITDTSNQKVRFRISVEDQSTTIQGGSTYDATAMRFIRLGDT